MTVRVRFAPSPTGTLHIGGARTALFNWLFARHHHGVFLLRIEDTDRERSTAAFEQSILDGMRWLGLDWDGEPFYQSQRMNIYRDHIDKLVNAGLAYRCYCTADELEAKRVQALADGRKPKYDGTCRDRTDRPELPFALRFRAPTEGQTSFNDICRGTITFDNRELDDLIIARSDGSPTYNFTVVVDDVTMGITHVIRGDDHINNTPRQVQLYQAMDYPVPKFAHLPMIHGPDKKKLSKRHGATSVIEYQDMGLLPEAVVNYLARLGWSHGDQEIFTRDELIETFDLAAVGSSPSVFDMEKLAWVNSRHLSKYPDDALPGLVRPFLEKMGLAISDDVYATRALATERERGRTLKELAEMSAFYFRDRIEMDPEAVAKWLGHDGRIHLTMIRDALAALPVFDEEHIAGAFAHILRETGLKMLKLAQPVRVALTGTTVSPGIYEVLTILGKKTALDRIDHALLA